MVKIKQQHWVCNEYSFKTTWMKLCFSKIIHANLWFLYPRETLGSLWNSFCKISKHYNVNETQSILLFISEYLQMSRCYWTTHQPPHLNVTFYVTATMTLGLSNGHLPPHLFGWFRPLWHLQLPLYLDRKQICEQIFVVKSVADFHLGLSHKVNSLITFSQQQTVFLLSVMLSSQYCLCGHSFHYHPDTIKNK